MWFGVWCISDCGVCCRLFSATVLCVILCSPTVLCFCRRRWPSHGPLTQTHSLPLRPEHTQVVRSLLLRWRCCLRSTATAPRPSLSWTRWTQHWTQQTWRAWHTTSATAHARRTPAATRVLWATAAVGGMWSGGEVGGTTAASGSGAQMLQLVVGLGWGLVWMMMQQQQGWEEEVVVRWRASRAL